MQAGVEKTRAFQFKPSISCTNISFFEHSVFCLAQQPPNQRFIKPSTNFLLYCIDTMGVTVDRISPGDGVNFPKTGDTVTIHYVGTLKGGPKDGQKFDASRDSGKPFTTKIGIGQVIKGWDEGVPQLSLGEKAILTISPDFGYGAAGYPPVIPPNSTLKFEVELLKIN